MTSQHLLAWIIAAAATAGVIVRPFRFPEAVWAVTGAVLLVALGLLPPQRALDGIAKGLDVYFFLVGMMLVAELARREGLFDWLAALAVQRSGGSANRLFTLIYAVGIIVTVFLSNDATAVVLTPAVYAATRAAGATPLPFLLICAFIANAASFVLPISNPANLVVFGRNMPQLFDWLRQFALPSLVAIVATYILLWLTQRKALQQEKIAAHVERPHLGRGGRLTAAGIGAIALTLLVCSALDLQLGLPTFICGTVTAALVLLLSRQPPLPVLKGVSWSVLPLVAGLFVLVECLDDTGVIRMLSTRLHDLVARSPVGATWMAGLVTALADNLMNNLPVGLIAGSVVANDHLPQSAIGAALIGVDLGPNLSVTGSLATILWLVALQREGLRITSWRFLRVGLVVMPPALVLTLAALGRG